VSCRTSGGPPPGNPARHRNSTEINRLHQVIVEAGFTGAPQILSLTVARQGDELHIVEFRDRAHALPRAHLATTGKKSEYRSPGRQLRGIFHVIAKIRVPLWFLQWRR